MSRWRDVVWGKIGYVPSPEQLFMHDAPTRFKLMAGGERAGKSYSSAMEWMGQPPAPDGLTWFVASTYELARKEIEYCIKALTQLNAVRPEQISWPKEGAVEAITIWGERLVTRSSDDAMRLAADAPNRIIMCEAAQQDYQVYLRLRGRVAEKRGWLLMSGTFEGSLSWYADLFTRWQAGNVEEGMSFSVPTWSNRVIYPGGQEDAEILALKGTYPEDLFQERFGGLPCPPATLVFREFSVIDHTKSCPIDPTLPVALGIDPGYAPGYYAVLAIQFVGEEVRVCDEIYVQNCTHAQVILEAMRRPWWKYVTGGVIDIAGKQHPANESAVEVWRRMTGLILRSQMVPIMSGIDRLHTFLRHPATGTPRLFYDPSCKASIKEYGLYRRPGDSEGKALQMEPLDRHNHALKAMIYLLVDRFGFVDAGRKVKPFTRMTYTIGAPS